MRLIGDGAAAERARALAGLFAVADVEASADTVVEAGGQLVLPKMTAGDFGSFAVVTDRAGAAFALFEGRLDD